MIALNMRRLFLFTFFGSLILILSSNTVIAMASDNNAMKHVKSFVGSGDVGVNGESVASETRFDKHKIGLFEINSIFDKSSPILSRQKRRFFLRVPKVSRRTSKPEFHYSESIPRIANQVYEYFDIISAIILAFFFAMPLNSYNVKKVLKKPAGPCIAIVCKFINWPLVSHIYQC